MNIEPERQRCRIDNGTPNWCWTHSRKGEECNAELGPRALGKRPLTIKDLVKQAHTNRTFPSELADIVIRVADLAVALGIDLEAAIAEKMTYNAAHRPR